MSPSSPIILLMVALVEWRVVGDLLAEISPLFFDGILCFDFLHETNYQLSKIQKIALSIHNQINIFKDINIITSRKR